MFKPYQEFGSSASPKWGIVNPKLGDLNFDESARTATFYEFINFGFHENRMSYNALHHDALPEFETCLPFMANLPDRGLGPRIEWRVGSGEMKLTKRYDAYSL